ncbi:hypothetical protein AKJ36_00355 [candidate division MSBL1 archaeon SCGC-AAA259I07]|uniref:Archaeal Type IV pilin N-terminal domain-containing protein n=1 Tax=candidate division MSBL1 archaeon SCGC-AAA259I07 TaxID=1698266 RepID=A0A133UMY4_9EURY|nr:hypothetical protein AKJ36_00355 [candidate division MSBL1 archaeon SCGC-AAA259I07]
MITLDKKAQGSTEYMLILAVVLVVAGAIYFITRSGGNYPAVSATPVAKDANNDGSDDLVILVEANSIPSGEWKVVYNGTTVSPDEPLEQPQYIVDDNIPEDTYEVTLSHIPSGHVYFNERITIQ